MEEEKKKDRNQKKIIIDKLKIEILEISGNFLNKKKKVFINL